MQKGTNESLNPILIGFFILISVIQFIIKAIAIWRASQLKQKNWYVALFILIPFNDLGVVEIVYLFWFARKRLTFTEVKSWFHKN